MKSYWLFFFCFHLTKINMFGAVLDTIPEEWKKYPKPVITNYHKPLEIFLNPYVSNNKSPIITSQVKTQNIEPETDILFSLSQNQHSHPNTITPQIVTQLEKTDNIIDEKPPNIQIQPMVVLSKDNDDDKITGENIKIEDDNETDSISQNEKSELIQTKELNINGMKNNTIGEEVKTDEDINVNRSVYSNDSILFDCLKQENRVDVDVPIKEENNNSAPRKEKYNRHKESGPVKYIIVAANNISTNHIDKDSDEARRTSDIEIVINDPDTNVILYRQDKKKAAPTLEDKLPNVNNENENSNIDSPSQRSAEDNGKFVTEQYTTSISNADNYANVYEIGTNTKTDDDIPTKYETFTLSDAGNKILNSNDPKICRPLRNTDLLIRKNPRKIKLHLNYHGPRNKLYFHKDYKNHNNFKLYYLRC